MKKRLKGDAVSKELCKLYSKFATLVGKLRDRLDELITNRQLELRSVARRIEEFLNIQKLTQLRTIDDVFHEIKNYYYYFNCRVIEYIICEFLDRHDELHKLIKRYIKRKRKFEKSSKLKELKEAITGSLFQNQFTPSVTTCKVVITLHHKWNDTTLECFNKFLEHYFGYDKMNLLNHISIEPGSICISFVAPLVHSQSLISAVKTEIKIKSMQRLGVFELVINEYSVVTQERDCVNLENSLIEAVTEGNAFEVSMLLSMGISSNINMLFELATNPQVSDILKNYDQLRMDDSFSSSDDKGMS